MTPTVHEVSPLAMHSWRATAIELTRTQCPHQALVAVIVKKIDPVPTSEAFGDCTPFQPNWKYVNCVLRLFVSSVERKL